MPPNLEKRPRTPMPPKDPRKQPTRTRKTPPWAKFKKKTDTDDVIELSSDEYVFEAGIKQEAEVEMTDGEHLFRYFTVNSAWLKGNSDSDSDID